MTLASPIALLEHAGMAYAIHEHEPVMTVEDARTRPPLPLEQYPNTLVFRAGDRWVPAALRGGDRVDYRRAAGAPGVQPSAITVAHAGEQQAATGCAPGGLCPIPLRPCVLTLVDTGATSMDAVFTNATRPDRTLGICSADLTAIAAARIVSIRRDE